MMFVPNELSATSTPNRDNEAPSVLKELQNVEMKENQRAIVKMKKPIPTQEKKESLMPRHDNTPVTSRKKVQFADCSDPTSNKAPPKAAKENFKKSSINYATPRYAHKKGTQELQRRQQAIEAMQLAEQRRLRLCQQTLAEEIEQLGLKPKSAEQESLFEKKRMEAKKLKEKRIQQHLAEQEASKKKKEFVARANFNVAQPFFRPQARLPFIPKKISKPPVSEAKPPQDKRKIIRYSKDELRAINPYGFYFLWSAGTAATFRSSIDTSRITFTFSELIITINKTRHERMNDS